MASAGLRPLCYLPEDFLFPAVAHPLLRVLTYTSYRMVPKKLMNCDPGTSQM